MDLLKRNMEKKREVYTTENSVFKYWYNRDSNWMREHSQILDRIYPGYLLDCGFTAHYCWAEYKKLPGKTAHEVEHTDALIHDLITFCLNQNKELAPYSHGDWVLSNILVDGDDFYICDWDVAGLYDTSYILSKIYNDLYNTLGSRIDKIWYKVVTGEK